MILERRSIPFHHRRIAPLLVSVRSYPLNRFSDIIELARLNEAWLLRRVNGKIDGEDGRGATVRESKRHTDITILDRPYRPRGHNFLNLHWTAKRKREVEERRRLHARYSRGT